MTTERKEQLINRVLDLLTAIAYDSEPDEVANNTTKTSTPEKMEMLTIKESAALISGLSEHTVRQLVKQGKVKAFRTGEGRNGKILVNKADLLAYFNGKSV